MATIQAETARGALTETTDRNVRDYLADKNVASRSRLEVQIVLEQARLRSARHASREEGFAARLKHARELIADYPGEPEGYGYLLSLAKARSDAPAEARLMARELLRSTAPDEFKAGARRVLARLDLEGKPLDLTAARAFLAESSARRRPVALYTWTALDTGFLEIIGRLAGSGEVDFIGVNLDANRAAAETVVAQMKLPGKQIYDGGGLDGPAATQLQLVSRATLYLIDRNGVLRDVNGHADFARKFEQIARGPEGRK